MKILEGGWDHREPLGDEVVLFSLRPGAEAELEGWENVRQKGDELDFEREIADEDVEEEV